MPGDGSKPKLKRLGANLWGAIGALWIDGIFMGATRWQQQRQNMPKGGVIRIPYYTCSWQFENSQKFFNMVAAVPAQVR